MDTPLILPLIWIQSRISGQLTRDCPDIEGRVAETAVREPTAVHATFRVVRMITSDWQAAMWHRPEPNELHPSTTALIVFDMLEIYRPAIEHSGVLPTLVGLVDFCRTHGVLVCFAGAAHRPDGADFTRVIADTDPDFVPWDATRSQPTRPGHVAAGGYEALAEFRQVPEDIDIPKHRWSAFHGTALDLTLRVQQIETV